MNLDLTPISAILDIGSKVIDRVWPDPATRDAAKLELFKAQQAGEMAEAQRSFELAKGQIETNTAEAANTNLFVAGWRPAVGWVCAASLAGSYLVGPLLEWLAALVGHPTKFPPLDGAALSGILMAMLGFGGMRTYEKVKGAGVPVN